MGRHDQARRLSLRNRRTVTSGLIVSRGSVRVERSIEIGKLFFSGFYGLNAESWPRWERLA